MSERTARIECDLLVLGSGMAGMTAASLAAAKGVRVVVVEKAATIGGSAALSGGYVWTCTSRSHMAYNDNGDPHLQAVVLDELTASRFDHRNACSTGAAIRSIFMRTSSRPMWLSDRLAAISCAKRRRSNC
jgi:glycine/D-amino acid oxidase-like deaminating enzyme